MEVEGASISTGRETVFFCFASFFLFLFFISIFIFGFAFVAFGGSPSSSSSSSMLLLFLHVAGSLVVLGGRTTRIVSRSTRRQDTRRAQINDGPLPRPLGRALPHGQHGYSTKEKKTLPPTTDRGRANNQQESRPWPIATTASTSRSASASASTSTSANGR